MSAPDSEAPRAPASPILEIENLSVEFVLREGILPAVRNVSLTLAPGETLGIVGESGCGKSITALSILRLIPRPPARIASGSIRFGGRDLIKVSEADIRAIRGRDISMIFQEPMTSLNPVMTIGRQIEEAITQHQGGTRREAVDKAEEMLRLVRIPEPRRRLNEYPHQLSGGMRQRVMIAMALACSPKVLLADEPTTALDVTIQAQLLELMRELKERLGTAIVLITHDLGLIAEQADRVMVMYAGSKVEEADVEELFDHPSHPYTRGLLGSVPRLSLEEDDGGQRRRLEEIKGVVPSLTRLPPGCAFAGRCPMAIARCREAQPVLAEIRPRHLVACFRAGEASAT